MGVDLRCLQLLRWASEKSGGLGRVASLGRQRVDLSAALLSQQISLPVNYSFAEYCEELLIGALGAESVDSFDNSDFEGCTYVADFNKPLPSPSPAPYSTVIDLGCLEHIYNVPQALANLSMLCAAGGQILHCLPANNFCGHGFWQFSPELFFSLYSKDNGYEQTQVFVVDMEHTDIWYEVVPPRDGKRNSIWSDRPLYILCRTVRRENFTHDKVQQSDYVYLWSKDKDLITSDPKDSRFDQFKRTLKAYKGVQFAYRKTAVALGIAANGFIRNDSLIKRRISYKSKELDC